MVGTEGTRKESPINSLGISQPIPRYLTARGPERKSEKKVLWVTASTEEDISDLCGMRYHGISFPRSPLIYSRTMCLTKHPMIGGWRAPHVSGIRAYLRYRKASDIGRRERQRNTIAITILWPHKMAICLFGRLRIMGIWWGWSHMQLEGIKPVWF